jgi:protein-S-isoprenylcysteine O-methyltransferase Ste14
MNAPALLAVLLAFSVIGLLPRMFFRRDSRLGPMWWVTAAPFFVTPAGLLVGYATDVEPFTPRGWTTPLALAAVTLAAVAIALIFFTLGTHRVPLALWHQDNDSPRNIVTYGAYGRIRHPFYAAFLAAFAAALACFPHPATLVTLGYAVAVLNLTAAREERRLSTSAFGDEYRAYMTRTGRFLPRPSRVTAISTTGDREPSHI